MHPWFKGIDWDKLAKKEITPPFSPNVKGFECTSNIDDVIFDSITII